MADTEEIGKMLDNLIDKKDDQAEVHFHDYCASKLQEIINGDDVPEVQETTITNEE